MFSLQMSNWDKALKFHIAHRAGDFLYQSHIYQKAIDLYKEAQVLLNECGLEVESFDQMLLHYKLALSYVGLNDFTEALESYRRLLRINEGIGNKDWEVIAYRGISDIHRSMGQHVQSIFFLRKLLQVAKETGNKRDEITAYATMGDSYYHLGKQDLSIKCQNDALKICRDWR